MTEMLVRRTLDGAEVAAALGVSHDWFKHNRAKLEREHSFPRPTPGMTRYDPLAIKLWQDRGLATTSGGAPLPPPTSSVTVTIDAPPDDGDEIDKVLQFRAGAITGRKQR